MKLIVKSQSVTFRRKIYAPGDEVDLPDQIAKNLIAVGICETPKKQHQRSEVGPSYVTADIKKEKKDVNKKMSNSR